MTVDDQRDQRTYTVIGAAMEVHRQLGCGFLENVYQAALGIELAERGIPFKCQTALPVFYKGRRLECDYKADFVCYESVIVELKAVSAVAPVHEAQVIHYLKATGMEVGLLINFGASSLQYKRLVLSRTPRPSPEESA